MSFTTRYRNLKARASRALKRGHKLAKRIDKLTTRKGCCVRVHGVTRGCYKNCSTAFAAAKRLGPTAVACARGGRGPCREQTSYKKSRSHVRGSKKRMGYRSFSVSPRKGQLK